MIAAAAATAAISSIALVLFVAGPPARSQEGLEPSLSQLKAPVCMSDQELTAYLTTLALATSEAILDRCKASFAGQLDDKGIAQIEAANRRAAERPGELMRKANAAAKGPFERAHPGSGGGAFAEVLQGELDNNMRRSRDETLEGCEKVIALWSGKIEEGAWEETLGQFGASTFSRDAIRGARTFPPCPQPDE